MSRFNSTHSSRSQRRLRMESLEQRELLTVDMTSLEQLFIELVNRARADPVAEIERIVALERDAGREPKVTELNQDVGSDKTISEDAKQPLAPHQALTDAMGAHVTDMLRRNYFGHGSPEGSNPSSRAIAAGYPNGAAENIAWAGFTSGIDQIQEVYNRHQGLVESVGHRINMMGENHREIGAGIDFGIFTEEDVNFQSIMAGTLFGRRGGGHFITGVAITDHIVPNSFYEIGEGIGAVTVTAVRDGTSETYTDITGTSGGYGIQVPDGIYTLTATGIRLSQPIIVRGVEVEGENVKIDFNSARMPTRFISGQFFDDANGNRLRDNSEAAIDGRVAYIDLNDDSNLDAEEPRVVSDSAGNYLIDGLLPGNYTIRQEVPSDWTETAPFGTYVVPLSVQNIVGVDFGSRSQNGPPIANDDTAVAQSGRAVSIDALQNDSDPEGDLDAASIQTDSLPANGTVTINDRFDLVYTSDVDFSGIDSFTYSVADSQGVRSNAATVEIDVTGTRLWHNVNEPLDVNNDGFIVPRDALIVIHELNINGPHSFTGQARQVGSPYYDVSGDDFLSPLDALRIIRYLNEHAGAGEPPEQSPAAINDAVFALLASAVDDDLIKRTLAAVGP